ncbi:MAG: hypothetical protein CMP11_03470 [Zetaproteobacteria bacterium]|nr:hypothetical protein [Pseudobdellovibrionaceae bacterium]
MTTRPLDENTHNQGIKSPTICTSTLTKEKIPDAIEEKTIEDKTTEPQGPSNDDLPLTVWLKGFEPYFSDFSLDANQVMEKLGIKRSRLNQISGRELRVGKARIDRYLRPVYRPQDVEKYLEWTRPTASHKRSSAIIEEAREKLEENTAKLVDLVSTLSENLGVEIEDASKKSFNDNFLPTQKVNHRLLDQSLHLLKKNKRLIEKDQCTRTKKDTLQAQKLDNIKTLVEHILNKVTNTQEKQETNEEKLTKILSAFSNLEKSILSATEKTTNTLLDRFDQKLEEKLKPYAKENLFSKPHLKSRHKIKQTFFKEKTVTSDHYQQSLNKHRDNPSLKS